MNIPKDILTFWEMSDGALFSMIKTVIAAYNRLGITPPERSLPAEMSAICEIAMDLERLFPKMIIIAKVNHTTCKAHISVYWRSKGSMLHNAEITEDGVIFYDKRLFGLHRTKRNTV